MNEMKRTENKSFQHIQRFVNPVPATMDITLEF